ncbi:uncharacterized protein LOC132671157 [Panthera onca]
MSIARDDCLSALAQFNMHGPPRCPRRAHNIASGLSGIAQQPAGKSSCRVVSQDQQAVPMERPTWQGMKFPANNQRGPEALSPTVQEELTLAKNPRQCLQCLIT